MNKSRFEFSVIQEIPTTPVKNQAHTDTCWSFATISFIESELLRLGKGAFNLSEMFIVRKTYPRKAERYVRLHAAMKFSACSLAGDALRVMREEGMVPEEVYSGSYAGESKPNHVEMDSMLKAALDAVINNRTHKLSKAWPLAIEGILDAYLGKTPDEFVYQGESHGPRSFVDYLGVNLDNYIELTSFSHQPFYSKFSLEVPDNWSFNNYFNLPLDEFMAVVNHALQNGYSMVWDGDITEHSFNAKKGIAILPLKDWDDRSQEERGQICDKPEPEKEVTQELRQEFFDNYTSTDDHLMHVTGLAKDQNDTSYYITKNSWGLTDVRFQGFVYLSEPYFRAKTISVMLHKDALPKEIATKLKI